MTTAADDRQLLEMFLDETWERITAIEPALIELEQAAVGIELGKVVLDELLRHLHSTKGNAAYLGLAGLVNFLHSSEQLVSVLRDGQSVEREHIDLFLRVILTLKDCLTALATGECLPDEMNDIATECNREAARVEHLIIGQSPSPDQINLDKSNDIYQQSGVNSAHDLATTVRVSTHLLDRLYNLVEELQIARNVMATLLADSTQSELGNTVKKLNRMIGELQELAAQTRLQPISALFNPMLRVVRDAGRLTGKEVILDIDGEEIEADRRVLQQLRDPLLHLLRNAVDHGIESSPERLLADKTARGHIHLRAWREESNLVIEVADDGRGIDFEAVRSAAVERGIIPALEQARFTEDHLGNILLLPGFSTRRTATNLSGRGVGLNIVSIAIRRLGGNLDIRSSPGKGTTSRLTMPMSITVVHALVFTVRGYLLALPSSMVWEIAPFDETQMEWSGDRQAIQTDECLVPLITFDSWPDQRSASKSDAKRYVLLLRDHGRIAGICCDTVVRLEDLVVKPLDILYQNLQIITGVASLGTGEIVQVLDPQRLLADEGLPQSAAWNETVPGMEDQEHDDASSHESLLLFDGSGGGHYAVTLQHVEYVARYTGGDIVVREHLPCFRYQRELIPFLDFDIIFDEDVEKDPEEGLAVVVRVDERLYALAIAEVWAIGRPKETLHPIDHPFLTGLLTSGDTVYKLVDLPELLRIQLPEYSTAIMDMSHGLVADGTQDQSAHALGSGYHEYHLQPVTEDASGAADDAFAVLVVTAGGQTFGIPLDQIAEIAKLDRLAPLAVDDAKVLKLANIRGEILPVYQLGQVLGVPSWAGDRSDLGVVVGATLGRAVFQADSIHAPIMLAPSQLDADVPDPGVTAITGLVSYPDGVLQMLDVESLVALCLDQPLTPPQPA